MAVDFKNNFPGAEKTIERESSALVRKTALKIEADIKRDMASPKHGRHYGGHVASARGEAPAVDEGVLINSVQAAQDGPLAAEVGTPVEYAPILEEVLERPAFERAGERAKKTFERNARRIR